MGSRLKALASLRKAFAGRLLSSGPPEGRSPPLLPIAYALFAGTVTLFVATRFYASLHLQTLHAAHWANPNRFDEIVASNTSGPWSAPLDDVFIHLDFARSTARGYPFEWSEGNGFSSGGTSLVYPWLLALGYLVGFRELHLLEWAGIVACVSVFGLLLAAKGLARDLPPAAAFLLPLGLLSVGALDWALWSGMEIALLLGLWGAAFTALEVLLRAAARGSPRERAGLSLWLGLTLAVMVATRPEGVIAAVVLLGAAWFGLRARGKPRLWPLSCATLPAVLVVVAQTVATKMYTGESSAAGALAKLELHHPYLNAFEVFRAWLFHLDYQLMRVTQYHFADKPVYGWSVWLLAAAALAVRRTRRPALILLASMLGWGLLVALNGQVRWQNERYSMPAVAWLLLAATLGVGALLTRAYELRNRIRGALLAGATIGLVGLFIAHQAPRFREQLWFYGRASRNILDQQFRAGMVLRYATTPKPHRVLVGDAGAIPYASDMPALDIIGLGGYEDLPFARATRHHVGAGIELIERLDRSERPDVLAIYPGWWGDLPLWFGRKIGEVPVRGNVICSGPSKVLYRADWSPLDGSAQPFRLRPGQRVADELDVADLVSEREHEYTIEGATGYVGMKLLARPNGGRPLWDAGRLVAPGASESFELGRLDPKKRLLLVVRAAPTEPVSMEVSLDGRRVGVLELPAADVWVEAEIDCARPAGATAKVRLGSARHERVIYHLFAIQEP